MAKAPTKSTAPSDLGFGHKYDAAQGRLINKDGSFNIRRQGLSVRNIYQSLILMTSLKFYTWTILFFVLINAVFALLFLMLGMDGLSGIPQGNMLTDFLYCLFFSIQTFTTVGYGAISPVGLMSNFLSAVCAATGLMSLALITGLFFARFSRPRSHIKFSSIGLITPYQDGLSFQCRIVNARSHKIVNLNANLTLSWFDDNDIQGRKRRFYRMPLERSEVVLFPLNWTLVHPITEDSPLYNKTHQELKEMQVEVIVMLSGFDESYNETIYSNTSYIWSDIEHGQKFIPMYRTDEMGNTLLLLDCLDKTEKLDD